MKLYIYGRGGTGREVLDIALRINAREFRWNDFYFIDDTENSSDSELTVVALDDIPANELCEVIVAVGEPEVRKALYNRVKSKNLKFATLIDQSSIVYPSCKLGNGCIIYPNTVVSCSSDVSENVMVQFNTIIGHDIVVGPHTVVSSCVTLGGGVAIGELTFVGMGSLIKERVTVGAQSIVGLGSVVYKDIPDGMIVVGNAARVVRRNEDKKVFK